MNKKILVSKILLYVLIDRYFKLVVVSLIFLLITFAITVVIFFHRLDSSPDNLKQCGWGKFAEGW